MVLIFHALLNNNFNDVVGTVDGTSSNISWKSTRRGLKPELNGTDAKITFGNIGTIKTISLWVHLRSTTESIIDLNGTQTIDISTGTVRGNSWTTPTIYVDGAATASLSNLTGYHQITITTATGIDASAVVAGLISASYGHIILDDIRGYDNELSAGEALALYNSTSAETGVQVAERSYQHDPLDAIPEQTDEVLRIGGKLPGDAVDTISDRALSNDATILGAMPADDNYFIGGRRFDGDDDYIDCGNDSTLNISDAITLISILNPKSAGQNSAGRVIAKNDPFDYSLVMRPNRISFFTDNSEVLASGTDTVKNNETCVVGVTFDKNLTSDQIKIYIGGAVDATATRTSPLSSTVATLFIGDRADHIVNFDGVITASIIINRNLSVVEMGQLFNNIASLPIFELNLRDYPDNPDAVWTDNTLIPFSSGVVGSNGTFSVDGSQLICGEDTSTCTFRNNFKFDGQEYINVKINGIVYSGTGTITQGTVTVSIAQGSNKITIAANNGDVIDAIRIQFRETV